MALKPRPAPRAPKATRSPGASLRTLRQERGLSLRALAELVDLPYSTLSKLENGKMVLTYDKMVSLAQGLQVDVGRLLPTRDLPKEPEATSGRRSISRAGDAPTALSERYSHSYLAQDLLGKKMSPIVIEVRARSVEELGGLFRHAGEEFLYVLAGSMELHSDLYAPLRLDAGDSVYFDSGMAHGYLWVGDAPCRVLCVCTGLGMQQLARAAGAAPG